VPDQPTSTLDPSLPAGQSTTAKQGIDATLAPSADGTAPPPVSTVPDEAAERALALLADTDPSGWPDE
jgi:hypothetical protein